MHVLTQSEIDFVSGGERKAGTLNKPTNGDSELGKQINDIAGMLNDFGGWVGRKVYDLLH